MDAPLSAVSDQRFKVLLTAQDAFPELEALFLSAQDEIILCFRIFDPWTKLRSEQARRIGTTWFDLLSHTLRRGVRVSITISDFDPIARADYHQNSWASLRAAIAAGEVSGRPDLLQAKTSMHPARVGVVPRVILWLKSWTELRRTVNRVNKQSPAQRERFVTETPFLRRHIGKRHGRLVARLWPVPNLIPVTHHQKLAVFDNKRLYIGGLDLDDRRYDTPEHRQAGSQTWHDLQVVLSGPEVVEAREHMLNFEAVTHGAAAPGTQHLLRTISQKRSWHAFALSPVKRITELAHAHETGAAAAQKLIYLETQFFRDRSYARHLADQARQKPGLRMILILPGAPEDVAFGSDPGIDARYGEYLQARCVKILRDALGDRLFIGSPAQRRADPTPGRSTLYGAPLIYLHAKVSIFDDARAIVSSANMNGRSLSWDTEAGVALTDSAHVRTLTDACFRHWLDEHATPEFFDITSAQQTWAKYASANARTAPQNRKGFLLPYASAPAKRFGVNLPGVPEEMA